MKRALKFFQKNLMWVAIIAAALSFLLSRVITDTTDLKSEAEKLENSLQNRELLLDEYAFKALEMPADQWLEMPDLPGDMVIYRYHSDTLQSWVHQFPIANDDLTSGSIYQVYRAEHYLDGQSRFHYPFTFLSSKEQYLNIGSSWYVIKSYVKDNLKVIAGLFIKREKQVAEALRLSEVNPRFSLAKGFDIEALTFESCGQEIKAKDNEPLFILVDDVSRARTGKVSPFTWLTLIFLFIALFVFYYQKRNLTRCLIFITGITLLRLLCFYLGNLSPYSEFFQPTIYADRGLFTSIGNLLLNNLYISFVAIAIYMMRAKIKELIREGGWKKTLLVSLLVIVPILLFLYINFTLRSLISNSSIVMELHRVTELSLYTLLCYLSYALLFLALMFSFQVVGTVLGLRREWTFFSPRYILIYSIIVSLYTLLTISSLSLNKEKQWSTLLASRLSVERDLGLELELRSVEDKLRADPMPAVLLSLPQENMRLIEMRFSELYFHQIRQKYLINLSVCRPSESILVSNVEVGCLDYFDEKLRQYDAVPIADGSSFFYLSNFNGRVGYLGVFTYLTSSGTVNLYIEINSRFEDEPAGYPDRLSDYQPDELNIPGVYSYAKYKNGRLVFYNGRYDYPMHEKEIEDEVNRKDNYVHVINKVTDDTTVVISRHRRTIFPYVVSLSYIVLFFSFFFFLIVRLKRARIKATAAMKTRRRSLGGRLNFLISTILIMTFAALAVGSIWYNLSNYRFTNRMQMEEKIQTVRKTFSSYFAYVQSYTDANANDIYAVMDRLANETKADINLYDPNGRLIRSTKQELFQKYILSSRMNPKAYEDIVIKERSQIFNKEKVGSFSFYSLYTPIYNDNGKLIAIANIPYFAKGGDSSGELPYVVATIINISILLALIALFFASLLSSRITRPISNISNRMKYMDVSSKPEHINYSSNDELGALVESYNKMVDDLAESTKKIAEDSRQKTWSEMARRIAHEIKNPLTPMQLSIQRLINLKRKNSPGWEDKLEDIAKSLLEQIDILSNTASEFSSFAKFYVENNSVFNLTEVIKDQTTLFDNREMVRVSFSYESEHCMVNTRKGQIIRVLVNLISNAVQSLESSDQMGFVRISLESDGEFYRVNVDDNGDGVAEENQKNLFQPNFTTKSSGNGLGLAISKSIIEQSGGRIWYEKSELGGARFSFTLPKYDNKE